MLIYKVTVKKRAAVLEWFYNDSFKSKHNAIKNRRQAGTGGWLLRSKEFQDWMNPKSQSASRLLWGYGNRMLQVNRLLSSHL